MTAADVTAAYDRAGTAYRVEDGAVVVVREIGKTLAEARVEVAKTADFLHCHASFARQQWGELPALRVSTRIKTTGVRHQW